MKVDRFLDIDNTSKNQKKVVHHLFDTQQRNSVIIMIETSKVFFCNEQGVEQYNKEPFD
jgi:hypothetical protein